MAFIALEGLPVDRGGIALIGLAFIRFILDLKVTGFIFNAVGTIRFILSSPFLFINGDIKIIIKT